ncbi:MAG: hypothetical protein KKA32_04300 [Actinobacteria bacterium]|nr:hypothetical protein [Actinomycetota bacterium]
MDLPGTPSNHLDPRAKKVWRIYAFVLVAIALLVCVALAVVMVLIGGPTSAWLVPLVATLVVAGLWIGLAVPTTYRRWRWEITDVAVRLQRGLIIVRRTPDARRCGCSGDP